MGLYSYSCFEYHCIFNKVNLLRFSLKIILYKVISLLTKTSIAGKITFQFGLKDFYFENWFLVSGGRQFAWVCFQRCVTTTAQVLQWCTQLTPSTAIGKLNRGSKGWRFKYAVQDVNLLMLHMEYWYEIDFVWIFETNLQLLRTNKPAIISKLGKKYFTKTLEV